MKDTHKNLGLSYIDISPSVTMWVYLGVISLAISGIYSVFLVLLRSPYLNKALGNKELFYTALVIHVNLSVFVWMLSIVVSTWCLTIKTEYNYWTRYGYYVALIGVILMALAPFVASGKPVLSNYIPMIENWCFIAGIVTFAIAILIPAILCILSSSDSLICYVNISSCIIVIMSYLSCIISYFSINSLPYHLDIHFFYEKLFWSGGHILQFLFVQVVMLVWIILIERSFNVILVKEWLYKSLFILNTLFALCAFWPHCSYMIDSVEFTNFFILHMKYCAAIAPSALVFFVFLDLITLSENDASSYWVRREAPSGGRILILRSLIMSWLLFFTGGLIGVLISGVNVTIPAHYHGSIVGISIAFMGFGYHVMHVKITSKQPYIYAFGQLLHIIGLALSGGYGILRKTIDHEFSFFAKITMGIMGIGGICAIIGGLMFVWICFRFHKNRLISLSHL